MSVTQAAVISCFHTNYYFIFNFGGKNAESLINTVVTGLSVGFCSMKHLGILLLSSGCDASR